MDAIVDRGVEVLSERVGSVMTGKVFTCSRHDRVSAVMVMMMTNRRIRHVPVVEHDGRLCGIVSIGDVVKQPIGRNPARSGCDAGVHQRLALISEPLQLCFQWQQQVEWP
jgi:CBS-domain-containing membrane protein